MVLKIAVRFLVLLLMLLSLARCSDMYNEIMDIKVFIDAGFSGEKVYVERELLYSIDSLYVWGQQTKLGLPQKSIDNLYSVDKQTFEC